MYGRQSNLQSVKKPASPMLFNMKFDRWKKKTAVDEKLKSDSLPVQRVHRRSGRY